MSSTIGAGLVGAAAADYAYVNDLYTYKSFTCVGAAAAVAKHLTMRKHVLWQLPSKLWLKITLRQLQLKVYLRLFPTQFICGP